MRLALEEQDVGVMSQPVKESTGKHRVSEDLHPARELQVGRDQEAASLVALSAELEEQRATRT